MNLEEINKEYLELKNNLETARKEIEGLESKANDLADDKTIWKGKLVEAKRNKDTTLENQAEQEIKRIDDEVKTVKEETLKKKDEIEKIQSKINVRLEELKENPEMKKHLDEVLAKKYDRKISKLEKEKEETIDKKEKLTNLNQLVTEHPALANNLKGIMVATKEIKDLQQELDTLNSPTGYTDPVRANEILNTLMPQAQGKLSANKTPLLTYISKNKLDISEKDIDELADKGYVADGKGNIDLTTTMTKNISSLNRQIKGYDKSIKNHQIALEKVDNTRESVAENNSRGTATRNTNSRSGQAPETTTPPENTKWYQKIVQKFKDWNERRKQQALPEPEANSTSTKQTKNRNEFSDSLKYDVVKDLAKQMEAEELKKGKEERKAEDIER